MVYLNIIFDPLAWFADNLLSIGLTAILVLLYFILNKLLLRLIKKREVKFSADPTRVLYIRKVIRLCLIFVLVLLLGFAWQVSFSGLTIYFASVFTVIGVALFASWSILSNLTASIILFFFFPYKIGYRIRIQDGENSIEGIIMDITIFHLEIELNDGRIATYPNNLAIQKPFFRDKK